MPDVAASDGSACSSGSPLSSHVLLAMGRTAEEAESTIRFSLGYATTKGEIEHAVEAVELAVREVRDVLGIAEKAYEARDEAGVAGATRWTGTIRYA
jgi:cysteine desulfurase